MVLYVNFRIYMHWNHMHAYLYSPPFFFSCINMCMWTRIQERTYFYSYRILFKLDKFCGSIYLFGLYVQKEKLLALGLALIRFELHHRQHATEREILILLCDDRSQERVALHKRSNRPRPNRLERRNKNSYRFRVPSSDASNNCIHPVFKSVFLKDSALKGKLIKVMHHIEQKEKLDRLWLYVSIFLYLDAERRDTRQRLPPRRGLLSGRELRLAQP